ncbi:MAG: ATP-dependent DNA helicase RecG [Balneolaceae bacterium]|nr:ATP-dependent DNA helicase RecG [Balneolaceae bacterium]
MKLSDLDGMGTGRLKALAEHDVRSIGDLLDFLPRKYLDRTTVLPIGRLRGRGEEATVVGEVKSVRFAGKGRKKRLEVLIQDDTASLKGVWFKGTSWVHKLFEEGQLVTFFGTVKRYGSSLSMAHPEVDQVEEKDGRSELGRIVAVYPSGKAFSKAYITSRLIGRWMEQALRHSEPPEYLPTSLLEKHGLPSRKEAYRMAHFPEEPPDYRRARERFKFEELFLFTLSIARIKRRIVERKQGHLLSEMDNYTRRFFNEHLPFELTGGQKQALADIKADVRSGVQMNRLIQGDVGSGKTVVAVGAMLMAVDNGLQACFMAPTEILAEQHFRTLSEYLEPLDLNVRLLTGSRNASAREDILSDVAGGTCQILAGTHAVIQDTVTFHNLGLAVIDEQHRFGVRQRAEILEKGSHPHVLVMSATPIPRSLAMTLYSDLDISVIRELPGGRKPVRTAVRREKAREDIYDFMDKELEDGGQAYVVYPLVEESEALDLKDATQGYEHLRERFDNREVGLLHGRMKAEEKEQVMQRFVEGEVQILVSTTVIEVGVDVPNASLMIVEHAERFGLSQLHQLRGRIGRGARQSYCILIPGEQVGKDARTRLNTMSRTSDGFEIAEVDLKLRGPGDFLGTRQSGLPEFRLADIVEDQMLLEQAREAARRVMREDPELQRPEHAELRKVFIPYFKERSRYYGLG